MQRTNNYKITDLIDKSKKIKIVSFYDKSVMYFGEYEKIPAILLKWSYPYFSPRKNYYEFMV